MKKLILTIGLIIALGSVTYAQGYKYEYVKIYAKNLGYNINQEWSCPLKQSDYFTKTFNFYAGTEYDLIALAEDNDVKDVDIVVTDQYGNVYVQDTRTSDYAEVNFTPTSNITLTVKVKNYSSNTPDYASKVYFMIAYK